MCFSTDGYIVCEEFEEILQAAWLEEQELLKQKEKEVCMDVNSLVFDHQDTHSTSKMRTLWLVITTLKDPCLTGEDLILSLRLELDGFRLDKPEFPESNSKHN